ncbi:hypothetical protein [Acinetobacter sp. 161(2023)]|uniref:hypothetical protein n=1 Tax=Acinetobacter sp. 161(2023) TaxID=3098768 RepID=UPI00300B4516
MPSLIGFIGSGTIGANLACLAVSLAIKCCSATVAGRNWPILSRNLLQKPSVPVELGEGNRTLEKIYEIVNILNVCDGFLSTLILKFYTT